MRVGAVLMRVDATRILANTRTFFTPMSCKRAQNGAPSAHSLTTPIANALVSMLVSVLVCLSLLVLRCGAN